MKTATKKKSAPAAAVVRSTKARVVSVTKAKPAAKPKKAAPAPKPKKAAPPAPQAKATAASTVSAGALLARVPAPLRSSQTVVYFAQLVAKRGWTVQTMPPKRLAYMLSRVKAEAAEALMGTNWADMRAACAAFPVRERRTSSSTEPRAKRTPPRRPDAGPTKAQRAEARAKRPLVDDMAKAVRVDTLEPGAAFKTPDSVREGIRGHYGVVVRHGTGSTIVGGDFPFDYIAPGSLVVPVVNVEGR